MRYHLLFLSFTFSVLLSFGQSADKEAYRLGVEGIQKVDAGDYEVGIKLLKKARNLAPKEYDYSLEIGKAYLKSGDPKKAEKYLFDLQYHVNAQSDLYLLLSSCYKALELKKKTPDLDRKKELKTLRYGVEKLPNAGVLYLELGKLHLEMKHPENALAVWEKGISNAPNFAENYFWASRILNVSGNTLWAWIYGETFLCMSDQTDLKRSLAPSVLKNAQTVFTTEWKADPEWLDQQLKQVQIEFCSKVGEHKNPIKNQVAARLCLLNNWKNIPPNIAPLFAFMQELNKRGWLASYTASLFSETEKERFLSWLAYNGQEYDRFTKWSFWNRLTLTEPISRNR